MAKKISIFIVVVMVSVVTAIGATIFYNMGILRNKRNIELIDAENLHIPQEIIESSFGLFFYDTEGNRIRTTNKNVPFDVNKPVIIFAHGISQANENNDEFFDHYENWLNAGYNVGCFVWNQFTDDSLFRAEKKVWSSERSDMRFKYTNAQGQEAFEENDTLKSSMAQTFIAYYYDFMNKSGYKGNEIRFAGQSIGAQLIIAGCSYLLSLEKNSVINKSFLPDRVTLFDSFLTNMPSDVYIEWLGKEIGDDGTVALAYETVKLMRNTGIAVEYICSNFVAITSFLGQGDNTYFSKMLNQTAYLNYNNEGQSLEGFLELIGKTDKPNKGELWYNQMIENPLPIDFSASASVYQYGISPKTPTSYIYARMGTRYHLQSSDTLDYEEDIQYSQNVNVPFVAGFAFEDTNKNGNYDQRLVSRRDGIKVELYMKESSSNKLIGITRTKNGGYYQIPIEPIHITNTQGKQFFIKVTTPLGYKITSSLGSDDYYMMANDIKQDNKSNNFFIYTKRELKIINIGITKK